LGVGVGPTGAGAGPDEVEPLRPSFVGVASFDDGNLSFSPPDFLARPIVRGIIPEADDAFLEFFCNSLPLLADVASSSFFFVEMLA
jgi:hypothetical protein